MGSRESGGAAGTTGRARLANNPAPKEFPEYNYENTEISEMYRSYLTPLWEAQHERLGDKAERAEKSLRIYEADSRELNSALRDEDLEDDQIGPVSRIDSIMHPLSESIIVHRGADIPGLKALYNSGQLIGAVIDDKAYMSTSINRGIAKQFLRDATYMPNPDSLSLIRLQVPKGKKAAITNPTVTGQFNRQREILLERNTKIKITRATINNDGILEIDADVLI